LQLIKKDRVLSIGKVDVGGDAAGTKARNDAYAQRGQTMALGDAELTAHRANPRGHKLLLWQRGFDVGSAVSYRQAAFGPGRRSSGIPCADCRKPAVTTPLATFSISGRWRFSMRSTV
jgi:hypothetical protein